VATLYPLSDWKLHAGSAWAFLSKGLPRYWTWFDMLSNLLDCDALARIPASESPVAAGSLVAWLRP
jgi:hypothetical protein